MKLEVVYDMIQKLIVVFIIIGINFLFVTASDVKIKIQGSSTVNPIISEISEIFIKEKKWTIFVDTLGGSSGGIAFLAEGLIDIGMSSRDINQEDIKKYPNTDFYVTQIAIDSISLVVSEYIWKRGIKVLTKEDIKNIYELKKKNWEEFNGPSKRIVFYNKELGRGTRHVFLNWLYGDKKEIIQVSHPEIGSNEEGKNKVSKHFSAMTILSTPWVKEKDKVYVVGLKLSNNQVVYPTRKNIKNRKYPIIRKLNLITIGKPIGAIKEFIDFVLSEKGQKIVREYGYEKII